MAGRNAPRQGRILRFFGRICQDRRSAPSSARASSATSGAPRSSPPTRSRCSRGRSRRWAAAAGCGGQGAAASRLRIAAICARPRQGWRDEGRKGWGRSHDGTGGVANITPGRSAEKTGLRQPDNKGLKSEPRACQNRSVRRPHAEHDRSITSSSPARRSLRPIVGRIAAAGHGQSGDAGRDGRFHRSRSLAVSAPGRERRLSAPALWMFLHGLQCRRWHAGAGVRPAVGPRRLPQRTLRRDLRRRPLPPFVASRPSAGAASGR
jgi:hypothetical protein